MIKYLRFLLILWIIFMSAIIPFSSYASNPYVQNTLKNPFIDLPDTEETYHFIKESKNFRFYIPKIEDLLDVIKAERVYAFGAMIESGMFDLKKIDPSGRTLMSTLERSANKGVFVGSLIDCKVNLTSLAPAEFWMRGVKGDLRAKITQAIKKSNQIRKIEDAIIQSMKHLSSSSYYNRKTLLEKITAHFPHLNVERIINVAMSSETLRPIVNHIVSMGGNPNRSRNALAYSIAAAGGASPLQSAIIPARFPISSLDSHLVDVPLKSTAEKLHEASAHGLKEHVFRSQLGGLFGLDQWPKTLDELPRPYSAFRPEDISDFFDAIKGVRGFGSLDPIILSYKDIPVSSEKLALINSDATRPVILTSGWRGHATTVVIVGSTIYKGNRTPFGNPSHRPEPGVYSGEIDRKKLTGSMIYKIITNVHAEWFTSKLELELGGAPTRLLSKRKPQVHPNCTWSSCAELSCYILQLHQWKTEEQAKDFVRQIRAKVRHSFLLSYLEFDRTHEPLLHSAPLLGGILAKCLRRRSERHPEYKASIDAIMASRLSVDMLQVIYNLDKKTKSKGKVIEYIEALASELSLSVEELFRKLDPYFRIDEHKYKQVLKEQDCRSAKLLTFTENFDVPYWLNHPLIPTEYKVALVKQLITPFLALTILAAGDHQAVMNDFAEDLETAPKVFESAVRDALIEVITKAGLTSSLIDRKHEISTISYTDSVGLGFYIESIQKQEAILAKQAVTRENAEVQKEFYEYIAFLLQDPTVGITLTCVLLQSTSLEKVKDSYNHIGVFPDDILLKNKEVFLLALQSLINSPGWDLLSRKRVFMEYIARDPFKNQVELLYNFLHAIEKENVEGSILLIEDLLSSLWKENPFLIQDLFSRYLTTSSISSLYSSKAFSKLVDFLWQNAKSFMQAKIKGCPQNVGAWPNKIRQIVYLHFREDPVTKTVIFPADIIGSLLAQDLMSEHKEALVAFLTEHRIPPFIKRRPESEIDPAIVPILLKHGRTAYRKPKARG